MPNVSVIVPNFNHSSFLRLRIESILNQTYQDFEIILLDDCSTDSSKELIEQYRIYPKVSHIIYNEQNSGSPFKQWNKGIALAKGSYIWIAESDDYCEPDFLASLVPLLDTHPAVGLAYSLSQDINENNVIVTAKGWWMEDIDPVKWTQDHIQNGKQACQKYFIQKNIIPNASAVVFKKNVFKKVDISIESMTMCGDWYCWIQMLLHSDYAYVAQPLNYQRKHSHTTRNVNSIEKRKRKINEELKIYYLLKKNFPLALSKEKKEIGYFNSWVTIHESKRPLTSLYTWPLLYGNVFMYLFLAIKFALYPIYAFFIRKE